MNASFGFAQDDRKVNMKIKIPKVVTPVDFGEYAEELRGQSLWVWVNPPMEVLDKHAQIVTTAGKTQADDLRAWYAAIWSEGAEDTRWTVEELRELEQRDPALFGWMISETWKARRDHVDRKKKA